MLIAMVFREKLLQITLFRVWHHPLWWKFTDNDGELLQTTRRRILGNTSLIWIFTSAATKNSSTSQESRIIAPDSHSEIINPPNVRAMYCTYVTLSSRLCNTDWIIENLNALY